MGRAYSTNGEDDKQETQKKNRKACRLLVRTPEGKKPRPRRRSMDNIRLDSGQIGWGWCGLHWSDSA
jgi:hypothetical protein